MDDEPNTVKRCLQSLCCLFGWNSPIYQDHDVNGIQIWSRGLQVVFIFTAELSCPN
jgi:hypothetical protein